MDIKESTDKLNQSSLLRAIQCATFRLNRRPSDGEKLQKGIDFAKSKGVIDPDFQPEPYVDIDVLGKTPEKVAETILDHVEGNTAHSSLRGSSSSSTNKTSYSTAANPQKQQKQGSVIVLVGLSGTGKGTTVTKLYQQLEQKQQVVTWSNGNIFRSVTLLAATWCEQQNKTMDEALGKENLKSFISMLSFGKYDGKYDTRIHGLGLDVLVSQVQNTELKSPKVSKNIPTVAEFTQGEVILFAANAVDTMGQNGIHVILEGREQTVNYVRTKHRFNLVLSDASLIGKRRAAQRLMAATLHILGGADTSTATATDEAVGKALDKALASMVAEIDK
jgi:cytidylate kinase